MIILKGSETQLKQMFANAANASSPVGMGFLQAENKKYEVEDIEEMNADYFHGRMMKTCFTEIEAGIYKVDRGPDIPNPEYQGWALTYPTYELLADTAGVAVEHQPEK